MTLTTYIILNAVLVGIYAAALFLLAPYEDEEEMTLVEILEMNGIITHRN